ncbi:MAG: bifunctional (p)ppGpp synthetase/guanosine-3',5'-bis(diphosphate) 3'-pyrophosphohydrolase [candidate division Zixibacteria bacterium]|nr:bifunctional (p)ppGpp synthetase/guanosine-3',5'-bis(diphosphate) 3'-pyrophosphohydrolase [candidate division Zixibacteria bacterium]
MNLAEFVIKIESFNANVDIPLLRKAYEFSDRAHHGQFRESGDPYIQHCLEVAFILAEQHLDTSTITAGMIHDVIEETEITLHEIKKEFGEEIAMLVDGVTKIGEFKFESAEEEQVEYYRKLLLSMAKDIRVIIIKVADRLHNMRTLNALYKEKQLKIAKETREVYAPLAHRFGMAVIKTELEDLSLRYIDPDAYFQLLKSTDERKGEREEYIQEVLKPLKTELDRSEIKSEIAGRAKHLFSVYRKIKEQNKPLDEIYDLFAIRVIVDTVTECYQALGVVHSLWTPIAERFRDYIATPKRNMYQSLHTTVIGPRGRAVEIQIRTHQMHHTAEYGIASHWLYKEGKKELDESDKQMIWLREVLEWQRELSNPTEFLEYLKIDLFQDDVFVFTPKGELRQLPKGSTPLDFAYAIHSDIGDHCSGSRVNDRMVPLNTGLASGDKVEIFTSPHQIPTTDWLKIVKTTKARSKIKHFLKQKKYEESLNLGREILEKELKKHHLKMMGEQKITDLGMRLNLSSSEALLTALGNGTLSIKQVIQEILPEEKPSELKEGVIQKFVEKARGKSGIRIQGLGNLMFRFARCCQPIPGERVVGFITRGRGVSVHRADCINALQMMVESDRKVEVEWDVDRNQSFMVNLEILVEDRKNILKDITEAIADSDTNVRGAEIKPGLAATVGSLIIEVKNLRHLNKAIKRIKRVKGVIEVERAKGVDLEHI